MTENDDSNKLQDSSDSESCADEEHRGRYDAETAECKLFGLSMQPNATLSTSSLANAERYV